MKKNKQTNKLTLKLYFLSHINCGSVRADGTHYILKANGWSCPSDPDMLQNDPADTLCVQNKDFKMNIS